MIMIKYITLQETKETSYQCLMIHVAICNIITFPLIHFSSLRFTQLKKPTKHLQSLSEQDPHHCTSKILRMMAHVSKHNYNELTTPMTEGSQPLYKALGPSSRSTVERAWNIPLYWYGDLSV